MIKLKALLPEVWDANLLEQSVPFIVFCDMDGVMCNFDLQFFKMMGSSPKEFEAQYGTLKFWNAIADKGADDATVTAVTKRVNGGTIGLPDRIKHFKEYYHLLA